MKIYQRRIFGWLIMLLLLSLSTEALFQNNEQGIRPAGMGGAFTAIADDTNSLTYNPAGLIQLDGVEIIGMYSDLYSNLNALIYTEDQERLGFNVLAIGLPISPAVGSIGLSWTQFTSALYQENTFRIGYGKKLGQVLSLGLNMKILNWAVSGSSFVEDVSRGGVTFDLGMLAKWSEVVRFGMSIDNLISADVGIDEPEIVPLKLRIGLAFNLGLDGLRKNTLLGTVEYAWRNVTYENGRHNIKVGVESWLTNKRLGLRAGVNLDEVTTGFSYRSPIDTMNLLIQFDYGFSYPFAVSDTWGSHRIGATLKWGKVESRKKNKLKVRSRPRTKTKKAVKPTPTTKPVKAAKPISKSKRTKFIRPLSRTKTTRTVTSILIDEKASAGKGLPLTESIEGEKPTPPIAASQQAGRGVKTESEFSNLEIMEFEVRLVQFKRKIEVGELPDIYFLKNRPEIKPLSYTTLNYLEKLLQKYPGIPLQIVGFKDYLASESKNKKLSKLRAEFVRDYLIKSRKIKSDRLVAIGYHEKESGKKYEDDLDSFNKRRISFYVIKE